MANLRRGRVPCSDSRRAQAVPATRHNLLFVGERLNGRTWPETCPTSIDCERRLTLHLALFNLAVDSKLRGCDLVRLQVRDVYQGSSVATRAIVMQQKTHRPVQFEITDATRGSIPVGSAPIMRTQHATCFRADGPVRTYPYASMRRLPSVGSPARAGSVSLRHALAAPHQSHFDLPPHQEHSCRAAPARTFQAGEHCSVLGNRGGRRTRNLRANRDLAPVAANGRYLPVIHPAELTRPRSPAA
jgi:hypothetical protein